LKKLYLKYLAKTLKNFELNVLHKVDGIAAITPCDEKFFIHCGVNIPVISIPVGISRDTIPVKLQEREFPGIFHLGSMDWMPNQEGIRWFLDKVWTALADEFDGLQLCLAGRNMPECIYKLNSKGVNVEGEVKNAYDYMRSKSLMIVPLLAGSGLRVKIIEGMACGNTIISTSTGAEGIACTDGKNIIIANTPEEFIQRIKYCIENPAYCTEIGENAKKLVADEYDNNLITARLIQFYSGLLSGIKTEI
jgi:polysaccharide biosynthesis protein PslH